MRRQASVTVTAEGDPKLTMRSSTSAPIRIVPKLMYMHATLGTRVIARDVPADGCGRRLRRLLKGDRAGDLRVTAEDSNYTRKVMRQLNGQEKCEMLWTFNARCVGQQQAG